MKRKSLLFLLLFALIAPWTAMGQETLTVYESETGTNNYIPIYGLWADANQQSEFIIPASELEDLANGTITQMTFHLSQQANKVWNGTAQVYLREVSETAFSTMSYYGLSGSELVYNGALDAYTTNEMVVPFSSTYTYGGGNLLVGFIWTTGGNYGSAVFYGKTDATNASISHYGSNSPSAKNFIPRTTFEYTPGAATTCAKPTNLAVSYEGTTASATWDGEASLYNIEINGETQYGVTNTVPYEFTVEPNTTYTVKVQADCGGGDLSYWTTAVSFTTPCLAFDLPYAYGFEDANELNCWNMVYTANTPGIYNGLAYEGNNSFRFSSYSSASSYDQYLISPELNTTNGVGVAFSYAGYTYGTETFKVGYSTTTNDPSAFTWGDEISVTGSTWQSFEENYPVGTKFVGIYYYSNYQYYLYVDGFSFDTPSDCKKPTNFVATEVGNHSAKLSWVENGEARAWNLKVNGEVLPDEIDENPYILSGLAASTTYTVQVAPVCEVEKWSDEITFTTEIACPAPVVTVDNTTPVSATMSWEGSAQGYVMEYMVDPVYRFENDLDGWTNITVIDTGGMWLHSDNNPGGYDYTTQAHGGTGFAMCYSYIDYVGLYNTDAYLVSPKSFEINANTSLNFWYDMANDSYPEYFEVCVATAANPTASDFTAIWTLDAKGIKGQKADVRKRDSRYDNWREVNVDLSAYAGQSIWIAFHDVNEDYYEVWIDDVFVDNGTYEWIPAPEPIASPYTLDQLDPETPYVVRLQAYCGTEDGYSDWTTVTFTTPSNCDAPSNLNVTNLMPTTATLNWTGYQDGFEVWYRPVAQGAELEAESFEGSLNGWTTIDADGDGYNWELASVLMAGYIIPAHEGEDCVSSESYDGTAGALTPDNYLVSPQVELGGTITFWAQAQDASYASEHIGVAVSTTSNTDASAFTTIQEWTMTAKKGGGKPGNYLTRNGGTRASGEWYQYTIDLSAYAGQTGYVAIRHFDCTDMFYLNVDDIIIAAAAPEEEEWTMATIDTTSLDIEDLVPETLYEWQVRGENRECNGSEDGYTEWSLGTFTTPGLCDNPINLTSEVDGTSVTLSWTGYQDSFDLTYYIAETGETFFEDEYFQEDWTYDEESENVGWYNVGSTDDPIYAFGFTSKTTTTEYLISPEMDGVEGASLLEFTYFAPLDAETFSVGYSTTDNATSNFTWLDENTVTGQGWHYEVFPEDVKYFAIKYTSDHADADTSYLFTLWFTLYDHYVAEGPHTTLTGVTSPQTITGLDENAIYRWEVTGICGDDATTQTVYSYFMTGEEANPSQTITLTEGWNWISLYVEVEDPIEALQMLEAALGDNATMISASEIYTEYLGDGLWIGDLDDEGVYNEQMYMIEAVADCEIELEGTLANAENYTIDINPGWNWIGFPHSEELTLEDALVNFPSEEEDQFAEADIYSEYGFGMWIGDIETLVPGHGYMYFFNGEETTPLVYNTFAKARKAGLKAIEKKTDKVTFNRNSIKKMK